MKLLVTGGAGFIGSALVRRLVRHGHRVLNLDKLTYSGDPSTVAEVADSPLYSFVHADITDGEAVRAAFQAFRPDGVLHLAAESHVDRSIDGPMPFVQTNVVGAVVMLQAAQEYWQDLEAAAKTDFRFVHVSTDEVYGSLALEGDDRFTETTPRAPTSPYSASKAAADHFARAWFHTYGLPVIITNCSNNYGPYQYPEKLIPMVIHSALAGQPIPIYGQGLNVRDWLYVDDHVTGMIAALERGRPGSNYNFGGNAPMANLALARRLCALLDEFHPAGAPHDRLITHVADRPGHDLRYAVDYGLATAELGWTPTMDLEKGLRTTVRWYLDNSAWCLHIRTKDKAGMTVGARQGLGRVAQPVD
ncbi:MAG: dTDP-glucose 4,6-dehydratase [Rhodospirillaceae bacterium]|nr:dTDP-glucose 4,6-dehydratase [Rhodospirillales bacterium]